MISQSDQIQYYMSRIFANEGLNEKDVQSVGSARPVKAPDDV